MAIIYLRILEPILLTLLSTESVRWTLTLARILVLDKEASSELSDEMLDTPPLS